ncbi:hypothetical protein GX51_00995 [Blastomyces parvus]|uniref:Uncharacterized protein n=1 Tax=Blastomyces parvus TaxID=2060905 RepID=A0A2B7XJY5_9EURO|nr:hypothetical protein GX51_00995 [Blastomyces parvus]
MSYLRLLYQLATQPRPSGDHRPKIDGGTVRKPRNQEVPQRDLLAMSKGAGGLKCIELSPEEGAAGRRTQRDRAIMGGGGGGAGRDDRVKVGAAVNATNVTTGQVNRGWSDREGHVLIVGCECIACREVMEARAVGGGEGVAGGRGAGNGAERRVRFYL